MTEVVVEYNVLEAGAATFEGLGSRVANAQAAGTTVTAMSSTAFGLLCSFFVPAALGVQGITLGSINAAGQVVGGVSAQLRATVGSYQAADEDTAAALRMLEGQL